MEQNEQDPELDKMLERMRGEFGARRPPEDEDDEPIPPPQERPADQMRPAFAPQQAPQPQRVMLRLPRRQAVAVWVLLGLNILMYVVSMVLSFVFGSRSLFAPASQVLYLLGWKDNELIFQGEYWRLVTAMFLHGSLIHILFNGYALYALGPESERIYGTVRFLVVYFLGGLAGSVASYAFSASPSVGASGAIFGLFGALSAFYFVSRKVLGDLARTQLQSMVTLLIINLLIGFSAGGVIDNFAHIGGFIGGALVGWLLAPRIEVDTRLYPPVLVERFLSYGWAGALAFALLLASIVAVITPPL